MNKTVFIFICVIIGGCIGLYQYYTEKKQKSTYDYNWIFNNSQIKQNQSNATFHSQPQNVNYQQQQVSAQQQNMVKTICPMCHGAGTYAFKPGDAFAPVVKCPNCNGKGVVLVSANELLQESSQTYPTTSSQGSQSNGEPLECPSCYGSGKCSGCGGRGEHNYSDLNGSHRYDCSICKGTGRCQGCHGSGHI